MTCCDWVNCADSLGNRGSVHILIHKLIVSPLACVLYSSLITTLYHDSSAGELEKPRIISWVSGHREAKPPVKGEGIMVCSPLEPVQTSRLHCCVCALLLIALGHRSTILRPILANRVLHLMLKV